MKKIDLTVKVNKTLWRDLFKNEDMTIFGHMGTHFDVMNKEFSLENTRRRGKIIDVRHVKNRDIEVEDIRSVEIAGDDFVMFHLLSKLDFAITVRTNSLRFQSRLQWLPRSYQCNKTRLSCAPGWVRLAQE